MKYLRSVSDNADIPKYIKSLKFSRVIPYIFLEFIQMASWSSLLEKLSLSPRKRFYCLTACHFSHLLLVLIGLLTFFEKKV
jgi:hypothetical protein